MWKAEKKYYRHVENSKPCRVCTWICPLFIKVLKIDCMFRQVRGSVTLDSTGKKLTKKIISYIITNNASNKIPAVSKKA